MSAWKDSKGKLHVGIMVDGKKIHRALPEGSTASDARRIEAEIRSSLARANETRNYSGRLTHACHPGYLCGALKNTSQCGDV